MTSDPVGPLSRPLPLHAIKPEGVAVTVEADAAERAALAADLGLPALDALVGRFRVSGAGERIRVVGRVTARLERTCVVTLEPFAASLDEEVEVEFQAPERRRGGGRREAEIEIDPEEGDVEELVGDRIDFGTITAEFLALGLDPHPRKPGAAFAPPDDGTADDGPFARLAALRPEGPSD